MRENYTACLAAVLKYEGGYSDHPRDPGGATMKGITQAVYDDWRKKRGLPTQPVRQIAQSEVEAIYRQNYWDVIKGDDLPSGLDLALFDYAVNSGPNRAVKHLQAVLGLTQDGVMGPATLAAAQKNPDAWKALCDRRLSFLRSLSTWSVFGAGWGNRVSDVRRKAALLAEKEPEQKSDGSINVRAAQKRLSSLSYPLGLADGTIGPLTRSAIRDFQEAMGEPVTGDLDQRTYDLLMSDSALPRPVPPEREALTAADLKDKGSTIVTAADSIKKNVTAAGAALAGASGVASQVNDVKTQVDSIKDAVKTGQETIPWLYQNWQFVVIFVLLIITVFCIYKMWRDATIIENERVRQARTGENVRI